jgi:hypothetical protein
MIYLSITPSPAETKKPRLKENAIPSKFVGFYPVFKTKCPGPEVTFYILLK